MYSYNRYRWGIGGGMTEAVKKLLIANGVIFLLQFITGPRMAWYLGLVPRNVWTKFYIWQFVTYMFLHANLFPHLLFNMYVLWFFGKEVESMWGPRAFYKYYFITGIGAGIIYALVKPFSTIPTIGASGAVYGVLTAFALMFPDRELNLLIFFIFPLRIRAKTLAIAFAVMEFFGGVFASRDGIAHAAHLGGMFIGYLYIKGSWMMFRIPVKRFKQWRAQRRMRVERNEREELEKLRRIVDQILDKANEVGMENLTRDEKILLKKASKIFKKKDISFR